MIMSKPSVTDLEKHFVEKAMNLSDIGVGEYIGQFETLWAQKNKKKYGVSCNSGTNAIYLALKALGIGPGDAVLVPEYTMIATAWAVSYTGATPVFVDCKDDLTIDYDKAVEAAQKRFGQFNKNAKAIIVVPIYGRPVDERFYTEHADKRARGILYMPIIEDMAEAHGIEPRGNISCYSFYGNKILTTGEGGMCITDNKERADEMRKLANMYFDEGRTMIHPKMGHNFRMTNLQAGIGVAQVMRTDEILAKRMQIEAWYDENLPDHVKMPRRDVLWMYDIQTTDHQEELKAYLEENGIPSRYGFKPMSMQPQYFGEYEHLNAYKWSKRILYLPTWTDMTINDVKTICQTVQSFEKEWPRRRKPRRRRSSRLHRNPTS